MRASRQFFPNGPEPATRAASIASRSPRKCPSGISTPSLIWFPRARPSLTAPTSLTLTRNAGRCLPTLAHKAWWEAQLRLEPELCQVQRARYNLCLSRHMKDRPAAICRSGAPAEAAVPAEAEASKVRAGGSDFSALKSKAPRLQPLLVCLNPPKTAEPLAGSGFPAHAATAFLALHDSETYQQNRTKGTLRPSSGDCRYRPGRNRLLLCFQIPLVNSCISLYARSSGIITPIGSQDLMNLMP